jgi:nucleotide-binding universal stress UspA family protein
MENNLTFQNILIAVDDSKYSYQAAAFGFSLAKKLVAHVGLVHINEFPVAINITGDPILGDTGVIIPDIMDLQKKSAQELFEKLKGEFGHDIVTKEYILEGSISNLVIETAKEFKADMIVMGTHGRTGFNHFISGSIAESVTRHANCPVLIVPNKD